MGIHKRLQFFKSTFNSLKAPEEKVASEEEISCFPFFKKAILTERFVNVWQTQQAAEIRWDLRP